MRAVLFLMAALPTVALAQPQEVTRPASSEHAPTLGVMVSAGVEKLSNDTPDWQEQRLQLDGRPAAGRSWVAALTRTRRFGLEDLQFAAVYADRLSPTLSATLEATISPTHRVLPRYAVGGELHHEFRAAWLAHVGAKTTSYDTVRANQGLLGLEHYFGSFSASAAWRPARAFGQTVNALEVRASRYYGEDSSITLLVTGGREVVSLGSTLVQARVRAVAVIGQHRVTERWALTYAVNRVEQGSLYTRRGAHVGLRHTF